MLAFLTIRVLYFAAGAWIAMSVIPEAPSGMFWFALVLAGSGGLLDYLNELAGVL